METNVSKARPETSAAALSGEIISIQRRSNMKKFNLSSIMHSAWNLFRKLDGITFADALRMAWTNAKALNAAKTAAGITETVRTWYGWFAAGREVIHESKAVLKITLLDPLTKSGTRVHSYFAESQTRSVKA